MRNTITKTPLVSCDVIVEAQNLARLRATWAEWLQEIDWSHYCTLTFRYAASVEGAKRAFLLFIRQLAKRGKRVEWASVIETSPGDLVHLHALLARTGHLAVSEMEKDWKSGITQIRRYDPRRGATRYMTKSINYKDVEIDVSRHLTKISPNPLLLGDVSLEQP